MAQQDAARAQAAADAPRPAGSAPTRTRCWSPSAPKPPATATSCADRDELRAERAERQADAYRDELTQLRAGTSYTASGMAPAAPGI